MPRTGFDENDCRFLDQIVEHGWYHNGVLADDEGAGFSYTTGLWFSAGLPEIICFSLKREIIHNVFWDLFRDVRSGSVPRICTPVEGIFGNSRACLFPIPPARYAEYMCWSDWFYCRTSVPALQLVWPDRSDLFPWQTGFDSEFINDQPDLTEHGWRASLVDGGIEAPLRA